MDKNEIEKKLADYTYARQNVERACLDIKNCVFFQVRTKNAKEILTKRAEESQT